MSDRFIAYQDAEEEIGRKFEEQRALFQLEMARLEAMERGLEQVRDGAPDDPEELQRRYPQGIDSPSQLESLAPSADPEPEDERRRRVSAAIEEQARQGENELSNDQSYRGYLTNEAQPELGDAAEQRLHELAEKAKHINDTAAGPWHRMEMQDLFNRNEDELRHVFKEYFPEGKDIEAERFDEFQSYVDRRLEAICDPEQVLAREASRSELKSIADEGQKLSSSREGRDGAADTETAGHHIKKSRHEELDHAREAQISDLGQAMRDEMENSRPARGMGLEL